MKILIVHEVNYLSKIIYEFQILPETLSLLGHEVTIVDYNDSWNTERSSSVVDLRTTVHKDIHRAYPQARVTVRRPGMVRLPIISRVSGSLTAALEIARVLRDDRPDVILLYGLPTIGLQTLWLAGARGVPVVFRSIDVSHQLVPRPLSGITKVFEGFVFNSVDLNIALTPHLHKYISAYGVSDRCLKLLPSGVDVEMFSPGPRNNELLRRWNIGEKDPVVLFMGTLYRFCGLDRVITDFDNVLGEHPSTRLLIVGAGEDEGRLSGLAKKRGLEKNVILTGMQPYAMLPAFIRSSDVCINPFELNGITENILPTKLFQYMTCEKPVLATALPGTLTFLPGEEQGIVYADLDNFCETLSGLLSDEQLRQTLGARALTAARGYGWRQIAETMVRWLQEVV